MGEVYNKVYRPVGDATFGHKVFREFRIPNANFALDTAYTDNDLTIDFHGYSRQAFTVLAKHAGGGAPTVDFTIEEFVPFPGNPNDGDISNGTWATKDGLGVASVPANDLFEHNSEDTVRLARVVMTPRTALFDGDVDVVISGRRDT